MRGVDRSKDHLVSRKEMILFFGITEYDPELIL
jgi:hypothetical protein